MIPLDMEITDNSTPISHPAAQFDLVAPIYPALECLVFGMLLDDARQAFFDKVLEADRILLVGEGNGRFLKSLIARCFDESEAAAAAGWTVAEAISYLGGLVLAKRYRRR